jgi:hypothetical protein
VVCGFSDSKAVALWLKVNMKKGLIKMLVFDDKESKVPSGRLTVRIIPCAQSCLFETRRNGFLHAPQASGLAYPSSIHEDCH